MIVQNKRNVYNKGKTFFQDMQSLVDSDANKVTKVFSTLFER